MTAKTSQQIKDLFDAAFDLAPEARERWLVEACAGDAQLLAEVQKLLLLHAEADEFLEAPPFSNDSFDSSPAIHADAALGRRIGAYQVIRELGRGGMGAVFLAHRADQTFEKQVAIKLVWPGLGSEEIIQRFQQERQILARLEHPHIARLLDGGVTEDGWHYLVMEYIAGAPITQYGKSQSIPERLRLFRAVCEAVQFAHQNLVIHRDLKPGNILVTASADGSGGTPKLLDFGIAKLLEQNEASLALTHTQLPLTPEYASPEQLNNQPITTATDVYSLGVVLYEMLTERKPYHFKSPLLHEIARVVTEVEPDKPNLNDDLDNIVLMALRKEAARRYVSVEQFSADIGRYLDGKTVLAHKPTTGYRVGKFVRRNKLPALLAGLLVLTLVTVASVALWQARRAREQARIQRRELYAAQMKQAMQDWQEGNLPQLRTKLAAFVPQPGEEELRGFEWQYLAGLLQGERLKLQFPQEVRRLAFAPDGKTFAVGRVDGVVDICDATTGQILMQLPRHDLGIRCLAFAPQGQAIVIGDNGGTVKLFDVEKRAVVWSVNLHFNKPVFAVAFAPQGNTLVTAGGDSTAKLLDARTGQILQSLSGHTDWVRAVCFTRDGKTLFTGSNDGTIRMWEFATGKLLRRLTGYGNEVLDLALTPDERWLAVGGLEKDVKLFDLTTGKIVRPFTGHTNSAWFIALSPDGRMIAAAGPDRPARVWEVATGQELFTLNTLEAEVNFIAFSPDGRQLVTGDGATLRSWELASLLRPQRFFSPGQCHFNKLAFSPDGTLLAAGELKKNKVCTPHPFFSVWDVRTGNALARITHRGSISGLAFGVGADRLFLTRLNAWAEIWNFRTAEKLLTYRGHANLATQYFDDNLEAILSLAVRPDGQMIATGDQRKTIKLWNPQGQELRTLHGPGPDNVSASDLFAVFALAFTSNGRLLAVGGEDAVIDLFNPETGEKVRSLPTESKAIQTVRFSPDDRWLAAAGNDQLIRIWEVASGLLVKTLRGHADLIYDLAWMPDGSRLASASKDRTVRVWNPTDGLEVLTFREHTDHVCAVAFSPDGTMLASASWDGTVRLRRASAWPLK